jgi:GntR family transcriptional regulator, transcriptional repressor for pyruvate dehydrogenase complex
VVQALRQQIIAVADGAYLGSEADLLGWLGVSSPTLRQAARLLEQQQLLKVERGNRGGYFARRPDAGATTRAAASYLEACEIPVTQVRVAARPLMIAAARLAAADADPVRRAAYLAVLDALKALPPNPAGEALLELDRALTAQMLDLAGNPAITLFLKVIYRLGRLGEPRLRLFESRPDYAGIWRAHAIRLGEAVLEGDPNLAALFVQRGMDMASEWLSAFEAPPPVGRGNGHLLWRPASHRTSAVQGAADALREAILAQPPGTYIGAEDDLVGRLGVGRHTLRQAAAMAQHDGLLEVRRGVNGGYVGRRPDIDTVADAAALYLELNHATLRHLMGASQSLATEACRLAAANIGANDVAPLQRAAARMAAVDDTSPDAGASVLRAEGRMMDAILKLSGNRPIELFVRSLYRYGEIIEQPVMASVERVRRWRAARLRLADAIFDGDGEAAAVICDRVDALLDEWLG